MYLFIYYLGASMSIEDLSWQKEIKAVSYYKLIVEYNLDSLTVNTIYAFNSLNNSLDSTLRLRIIPSRPKRAP